MKPTPRARLPASLDCLTDCLALQSVDGLTDLDQIKKINLFESSHIAPGSLDALQKRFPKCYLVLPDGTGLNPPRPKDASQYP